MKTQDVIKKIIIFALFSITLPGLLLANPYEDLEDPSQQLNMMERELRSEKRNERRYCGNSHFEGECEDSQYQVQELEAEVKELKRDLKRLQAQKSKRSHSMAYQNPGYQNSSMNSLMQMAQIFAMYGLGNQAIQSNASLGWPTYPGMSMGGMMGYNSYGSVGGVLGYGGMNYGGYSPYYASTSVGGIPLYSNSSSLYGDSFSNYYLNSGMSQGGIPLGNTLGNTMPYYSPATY